ncbi:MAG: hypothetical protein AB7P78_14435 [Candidatus Binatia bacterium]
MREAVRLMVLGLAIAAAGPAQAAVIAVTTTADSGPGSLRAAIDSSNMNVNVVDTIEFDLPGPSFTIKPLSALPTITDPVTIDGYTQNGAAPNTLPPFGGMGTGTNAVLLIEIDGSVAGNTDGLLIDHINNLGAGTTIRGLVINNFNSNMRAAIRIADDGNNVIEGNFIGTDRSGLVASPNFDGISTELMAAGNRIGGTTPAARNLISGNTTRGIVLDTNTNEIEGNLIGVDRTGNTALGNGVGIFLFNAAGNNTIGGLGFFLSPAANTVSGNLNGGIMVGTNSVGNDILSNRIGLGADGLTVLGNGTGPGVTVGGNSTTIVQNSFAGNSTGISIGNVTDTTVQANLIGLPGAGNVGSGITIAEGNNNLIGGDVSQANTIAGNGGAGVHIGRLTNPANGNAMLSNSIHHNAGLGIELVNGANNNQPAPQLTGASGAQATRVQGTLNAAPLTAYHIQFFANTRCDLSGFGEGEELLGDLTAMTDGTGLLSIDVTMGSSAGKPVITATATDPNDNTSQFSNCVLNRDAIQASPAPALGPRAAAAALLLLAGIGGVAMRRRFGC